MGIGDIGACLVFVMVALFSVNGIWGLPYLCYCCIV